MATVSIPGETEVYLRDGIYASGGNFAFDFVLLAPELWVVWWAIAKIRAG